MAFEQPPKKRRRYEMFMTEESSPAVETTGKMPSPTTPAIDVESTQHGKQQQQHERSIPVNVQHGPKRDFAPEDKLKKKRNRKEIGNLYTAYRRLKFCLARQDESNFDLRQDLDTAYNALLELSNGCMSVRRIAAELIPRYAVFCPSALEAGAQATFQLCDWSSSLILQGNDVDGIAVATAEACFSGFVHLSAAAGTNAPEQSALGEACTAVCRNVAHYLLRLLNGRDLLAPVLKGLTESSPAGGGRGASDKLERLVSLSLCRVFSVDPEGVLSACFDLLRVQDEQRRQDGLHFIAEIMNIIDGEIPALPSTADGKVVEAPKVVKAKLPEVDSKENEGKPGKLVLIRSLIAKVVHPKPALERWLVSAVRHFRRSIRQELVDEVLPLLFSLLKSLRTFSPSDLELEIEPKVEVKEEEKQVKKIAAPVIVSHVKVEDSTDWQHDGRAQPAGAEKVSAALAAGESSRGKEKELGVLVVKKETGFSQEDDAIDVKWHAGRRGPRDIESSSGADGELRITQDKETGNGPIKEEASLDGPLSSSRIQGRETGKVLPSDGEAWSRANSSNGGLAIDLTVNVSALISSPQQQPQPPTPQPQVSSPTQLSDGDPAAMDVFAASQHLWVGALGLGVTESQLRFHFEKFGPLESVSLFRSRDFVLVDFQNLRDAVKAREVMQGAMTWGKAVQIKFLDKGLGTRGSAGGVAIGRSCHVWVGGVSSQNAKEDLLKGVVGAGLKGPRSVVALVTASAILLEFEVPEEAAAVMVHIRQRRKEGGGYVPTKAGGTERSPAPGASSTGSVEGTSSGNRHLWVGRIDASIREEELLSSFSKYGDLTGWKFIRTSGCCFIDFRQPECAALARQHLNGTRFGIQCIVVEYKNTPQNRTPGPLLTSPPHATGLLHSPSLSTSGGRFGGSPALTAALNALQSKLLACSGSGVHLGRSRSSRGGGREGNDRIPTNTLWIGLPDLVGPNFMNEIEMKNIFTLAATGVGSVTKVRCARTSRGPCRFVEFDRVEAAAAALRNVSGKLDPSIQIEFSNSAISMQQSENSHVHGPANLGQSQMSMDDMRRRSWEYQRDKERPIAKPRERESDDPASPPADREEAGTPDAESYPTHPPGWGAPLEKEVVDEGHRREGRSHPPRSQHDGPTDTREDSSKGDSGTPRANSYGGFQTAAAAADAPPGVTLDSPVPSSHPLLGKKPVLDRQQSSTSTGPMTRPPLPPQGPTLTLLPVLKHPPWVHSDRVPPTSSWSGGPMTIPSSPLGQVSPNPGMKSVLGGPPMAVLPYGGQKLVKGNHSAPPLLQSPVTPGLCNLSLQQPLDQLGNPQAPSVSQPGQPFVDHMVHPLVVDHLQQHQPLVHPMSQQPLDHMVQSLDPFVPHGDQLNQLDLINPPPLPPLPPSSPPPPPPSEEIPPPPPPFSPPLPPPPSSPPPPLPPPPTDFLPEAIVKGDGRTLGERHWRGPLCKSGMEYCDILAFHEDSSACQYEHNLREPIEWPTQLDVTKRADFKSVKNTFNSTSTTQREVCRLFAAPGDDNQAGFQRFISYLKQRERAGVVKIGAGEGMWPRMLYLLPWSIDACALLAISTQPTNCLIGLMLPSLSTFA